MTEKPGVVGWFKGYCVLLALSYVILMVAGIVLMSIDPATMEMEGPEAKVMGIFYLVLGLPFFILSLIPLFLKPKPGVWVFDLVVICLGMTSGCYLPICIPLLIFWLKPETKAYFGKT